MAVFYQILILDIALFLIGGWFLYDTRKHPKKNSEAPYDVNYMNYLRGVGCLIFAIIFLITLIFW